MSLTVILSVGRDPQSLGARSLVMQSAGYIVVSAYSVKEAIDRFQEGDFDLILMCQSLPPEEKDRLSRWIRAAGSGIPVVSVSGDVCEESVVDGVTVGSDPRTLLWGLREVLINAQNRAAENRAARAAKLPARPEATAPQIKKPPRSSHEQSAQPSAKSLIPFRRAG